jgi:peptidoglycan/LPS O-acetylase OafA/YrhL
MKLNSNNRILELDALRGIAALSVVCFHATMGREEANYGFKLGVTGVDLFFIISGFVILLTLEKTQKWQDFVVSRFSRIFPTYWTCVTFTALSILIINYRQIPENIGVQYLANLTMFQLYFHQIDMDGPYWTMIVELLFYLVMLTIYLFKSLHRIERIGILFLFIIICYHLLLNSKYHFLHELISYYFPLINYFPLFFAGIIFYKLKFSKYSSRNAFFQYILILICFVIQYNLFDDGVRSSGYIDRETYGRMLFLYLIVFLAYVNNHLFFIVNPISIFLGNISYSLYLVHQRLILRIFYINDQYFHLNFFVCAIFIALPIAAIVATIINKKIEKPMISYIRNKYRSIKQ